MDCKDCVYGYYSDEQGVVVCMADEAFLAPCEYEEKEEVEDKMKEDLLQGNIENAIGYEWEVVTIEI